MARSYHGARAAAGPLLFVEGTRRAILGEWATIRVPGQASRRGLVIEAGEDRSVVQVLDDTIGLSPAAAEVILTGQTARVAVGRELLGRTFSGGGLPLDGLPAPVGEALLPLWGAPINPARRRPPAELIETGISAIDGLNTLVRGQKLPVLSGPGLPALEVAAAIVENARTRGTEPFAVVFSAIGIPAHEAQTFVGRIEQSGALARSILYLNQAGDSAIERLLAPRLALTAAEHLAFTLGMHVLVVLADVTHYCEALRELSTAREEVPSRRGYPGYMYSDLATLFERAGLLTGRPGSITQIPILTMPDDDITHPIPDLTGYITEGQIVLGRELHRRGVFPPIDVLPSLSRLMNAGIGPGRTVDEHRRWADQLYALYAQGREARLMAATVGESGLTPLDRRCLDFADRFEQELVGQGSEARSIEQTIELGWKLLEALPRSDLLKIDDRLWATRRQRSSDDGER